MDIKDMLIKYVKIHTTSDPKVETCPSTKRQLELANLLVDELHEMGIENAHVDENGYVYAFLESNLDYEVDPIGFVAHMDTAPDFSGENVNPKVINYTGGDIKLSDSVTTKVEDFPFLNELVGKTLIVTDGTTLLGADNKAGIASIMNAIEYITKNPEFKHGKISIGFTPDEEIGRGADLFDVEKFGAKFAYTIDGGPIGELEYKNFNAASADIVISGKNVHPGSSKKVMINSIIIGMELFNMLPVGERPEYTENFEGFFFLNGFDGNVEKTIMEFIIRDHDREKFETKKSIMQSAVDFLNKKYNNAVELKMKDSYYNMEEVIVKHPEIIDLAYKSMEDVGVTPQITPVRGGTDGARLSYMGLPCPNIFTGGYAFHGKHELLALEELEKSSEVVLKIIENNTKRA